MKCNMIKTPQWTNLHHLIRKWVRPDKFPTRSTDGGKGDDIMPTHFLMEGADTSSYRGQWSIKGGLRSCCFTQFAQFLVWGVGGFKTRAPTVCPTKAATDVREAQLSAADQLIRNNCSSLLCNGWVEWHLVFSLLPCMSGLCPGWVHPCRSPSASTLKPRGTSCTMLEKVAQR